MEETWRDVPGYEGLYQISIDTKEGKCRSLRTGKLLSLKPCTRFNRIYWDLCKEGTRNNQQAAVWIALTYPELVENEYFEGAEIDHKDTDRLNNHPSNLRWVTRRDNLNNPLTKIHNSKARIDNSHCRPVVQLTVEGEYIAEYISIKRAKEQTGCNNIGKCCRGLCKTSGSVDKITGEFVRYIWKYK